MASRPRIDIAAALAALPAFPVLRGRRVRLRGPGAAEQRRILARAPVDLRGIGRIAAIGAQAGSGIEALPQQRTADAVDPGDRVAIAYLVHQLRALGCHLVQGYAIARPMSLPDTMRWMGEHPHGVRFELESATAVAGVSA